VGNLRGSGAGLSRPRAATPEIERFGLVDACGPLLAEGKIKLYSVDSVAGRT
jgi:esterase/lipase superfamily enzyme